MKLLNNAHPSAEAPKVRGGVTHLLTRVGIVLMLWGNLLPGCNAPPPGKPLETAGSPVTETVVAEWDDVEASVRGAGFSSPAVFVMVQHVSERHSVYTLTTAGDEDVTLTATRANDENLTGITLSAKGGLFGNVALERDVVESVTNRLADLRGVKYRALDGYK